MTSLQDRPAAGLYVVAWLLSGIGLGLLILALQIGPPLRGVLAAIAVALLVIGLASGAGYQIVSRRSRPPGAFRGASPPLLLLIQVICVYTPLLVLSAVGLLSPGSATGFLMASLALFAGYVLVVWLFALRTGVLNLRDLGLPARMSAGRLLSDVVYGAAIMPIVWLAATLAAALVALLLGTRAPSVVPSMGEPLEVLLVLLGGAILVPAGEEIFFRGYALTAWLRDLGPRQALLRSTLFFAFVHVVTITSETFDEGARQALLVVVAILPVGYALGWVFLRRGLIAAIAGHASYNLVGVLLLALAQNLPVPAPG